MESSHSVALFLALGVIILASRVAGSVARALHQPRVLGELIVGVLLGPTLLDLLHTSAFGIEQAHLDAVISGLAELGVLLLMFSVGLEVEFVELTKTGGVAFPAGILGALLPAAVAVPVVLAFGYSWEPALYGGVALAATSVSISAQVLIELGVMRTKVGLSLLATALVDDVVAILLVSLVTALSAPAGALSISALAGVALRMALYISVAFPLAWFGLPRLMHWIGSRPLLTHAYGVPTVALIAALLFGWSAEYFGGVAAITGAFIAGVGIGRTRHDTTRHQIETAVANLAYVLLVPIFFVSVGLEIDLSQFPASALPLAALLMIGAVTTKIVGGGWAARRAGFTRRESVQLGVCMVARGEVGLIIASIAVSNGVLKAGDPLFSSLFLTILVTTMLTPLLVRRAFAIRGGQA